MKRHFLSALCVAGVLLTHVPVGAGEVTTFDSIVDFSVTLRELADIATERGPGAVTDEPLIIVDGFIASVVMTDEAEGSFAADVELVDGEWLDPHEVRAYRAIAVVAGEHFRERIPRRPPPSPPRDHIVAGRHAIAVARLVGIREDETRGGMIPVLEVVHFRVSS